MGLNIGHDRKGRLRDGIQVFAWIFIWILLLNTELGNTSFSLYLLVGMSAYEEKNDIDEKMYKLIRSPELSNFSWKSPNQEIWIPATALLLGSCVILDRLLTSLMYNLCISKLWVLITVHSFHKYWTYSTYYTSSEALGIHNCFCLKELCSLGKLCLKQLWYGVCYNKDRWA